MSDKAKTNARIAPPTDFLKGYQDNFDTLLLAAKADRLALLHCSRSGDGSDVAVICAVNARSEGLEFLPLAEMAVGNPFSAYVPPIPPSSAKVH